MPASFTATAVWPLVVDPLLTTFAVDTSVSDVQDARVACEPTTGNWLVVAEEHLSATNVDIVCHRYGNAAVPTLLDTVYAESGADRSNNPGVGFVAQTQQFVVMWHNATAGNFQWRARNAGSTTMNGPFSLSGGIGGDLDNRPMVGSTLSGSRFLSVLFRRNVTGTDILATVTSPSGANFGSMFVGPLVAPSAGTAVPGGVPAAAVLVGTSSSIAVPSSASFLQLRLAFQGIDLGHLGGCPAPVYGADLAVSDTLTIEIL